MPWGKLDDSLYDHPKLDKLGRHRMACAGLWAVAISWCNRRLTDGFVPLSRVGQLGGTTAQADLLVKAGLFEKVPDGYQVHDFLDFNDSKEYVLARREKDAVRQRLQRESKQESQRDTGRTNGVTPPVSPSPARGRVPGPARPSPSLPGPTTDAARDEISEDETDLFSFLAQHGAFIRPDSGFGIRLLGLIDRRGVEVVLEKAREMDTTEPLSDRQWVFGLEKGLEAIPSPPMDELLPDTTAADEKSKRIYERMVASRLEFYRQSGKWDPEWGPVPEGVSP